MYEEYVRSQDVRTGHHRGRESDGCGAGGWNGMGWKKVFCEEYEEERVGYEGDWVSAFASR